jgi:hypothetical protein
MASSKCRIDGCKRGFDTVCAHCQGNFCTKHYIEHAKLANDELIPLVDQLNSMINTIQQLDPVHQAFEQLEQWRQISHRHIDEVCDETKRELKVEVQQKVEKQMKQLHNLSQQVKELIDEGDASFKLIEDIKRDIEECQKQCKEFEQRDYIRLHLKPVQIKMTVMMNKKLFTGDGTLLSLEQQIKLNEWYGKADQTWMLVYKATRDGFESTSFHRCCNNQGPTITVIKSKEGGFLFGGYTSVSWRSIGAHVADNNGPFLFTLTNPHGIPATKYSINKIQHSIYDNESYGPVFGTNGDLTVHTNSQTNSSNSFSFPGAYNDTTNRGALTFTGTTSFQTSDIEVYRLL